jgi:hypothetical protein
VPTTSAASKAPATTRAKKTIAKKRLARPRRRAVKKVVSEVRNSEVVEGDSSSPRRTSTRQIEQLALLTLALVFGLIGLAVHVLWFVSIVLMAVQLGLIASELGNRRGRGVISEVAEEVMTVVDEIKTGSNDREVSPVEEVH